MNKYCELEFEKEQQMIEDLRAAKAVLDKLEYSAEGDIKRYPEEQDVLGAEKLLQKVIATITGDELPEGSPTPPVVSEAEKTKVAYAYFTIREWEQMALAIYASDLTNDQKMAILQKFPSASL